MSDSSYHDKINNLTNKRSLSMFVDLSAKQHYEEGFRNARKKSAEIVIEAEKEIEELKEIIELLQESLCSEEEYSNHLENILARLRG